MHGEAREQALAALARRAGRRGYAIAIDLLGSRAEAEDAVQEGLAQACAGYERLRDAEALDGWFLRVVTNVCLRTLRRRRLTGRLREWLGLDWIDHRPLVDERMVVAEGTAAAVAAVARLPEMQRAALLLRYGHDRSVGEVAELLGVGEGTVKTHLVRALAALRTQVATDGKKS